LLGAAPDAATQRVPHGLNNAVLQSAAGNSPSSQALSYNDVSGKDTRSCSDAAFMHASLKLQSRKYAR